MVLYHVYLKAFRKDTALLDDTKQSTSQIHLENIESEMNEERTKENSCNRSFLPSSSSPQINFQDRPSSSNTEIKHLSYRKSGAKVPEKTSSRRSPILHTFLWNLLTDPTKSYSHSIVWTNESERIFKIVDSKRLASLWGKEKNRPAMTYEKLSRSLRFYYGKGMMAKAKDELFCYRFLINPTEELSTLVSSKTSVLRNSSGRKRKLQPFENDDLNTNHKTSRITIKKETEC